MIKVRCSSHECRFWLIHQLTLILTQFSFSKPNLKTLRVIKFVMSSGSTAGLGDCFHRIWLDLVLEHNIHRIMRSHFIQAFF